MERTITVTMVNGCPELQVSGAPFREDALWEAIRMMFYTCATGGVERGVTLTFDENDNCTSGEVIPFE